MAVGITALRFADSRLTSPVSVNSLLSRRLTYSKIKPSDPRQLKWQRRVGTCSHDDSIRLLLTCSSYSQGSPGACAPRLHGHDWLLLYLQASQNRTHDEHVKIRSH